MSDLYKTLSDLPLFSTLSAVDRRRLAGCCTLRHARSRHFVFRKGEPITEVYFVIYGSVKIQETLAGNQVRIFNFLGQGEFLGVAMAGLPTPTYPACAQCLEDTTLLIIPLQIFFEFLRQRHGIARAVNRQISERFLEFQNDTCMSQQRASLRIADLLLRLLDRQPQNSEISLPLTRADLAHRVGTKTETVIRVLSDWTKAGILETQSKRIRVLNTNALKEIRYEGTFENLARGTSLAP